MQTDTNLRTPEIFLLCLLAAVAMPLTLEAAPGKIEPAALELADAVTAKLGAARTIRVHASHTIRPAPALGGGSVTGRMEISVQRPNRFHAIEPLGTKTLEIAFDGTTLCVMYPRLGLHGIEPLAARSIEQFADAVDSRFGFRPPVAELLGKGLTSQLLHQATAARVEGEAWVGFTRCNRLHIERRNLTCDIWIGLKDKLPKRMLLTYLDKRGNSTWDIRLSRWDLDAPVNMALFSKRPDADSLQVKMLPSL